MQPMPAVNTPPSARSAHHNSRSFADLPDAGAAVRLLDEIAGGACAFSPVPMDRPLALYGAGNLGRMAREFLTGVGHDFALVIDRNAEALARDPYWAGVELKHPDDVPQAAKRMFRVAVSIVTSPYVPIERFLLEQGFDDVVPFYDLAESFRSRASAVERLVCAGADGARPREHGQRAGALARRRIPRPSFAVPGLARACGRNGRLTPRRSSPAIASSSRT